MSIYAMTDRQTDGPCKSNNGSLQKKAISNSSRENHFSTNVVQTDRMPDRQSEL